MNVGSDDGVVDGANDGSNVGSTDGKLDGSLLGILDGFTVGKLDGVYVGNTDGKFEGTSDGLNVLPLPFLLLPFPLEDLFWSFRDSMPFFLNVAFIDELSPTVCTENK